MNSESEKIHRLNRMEIAWNPFLIWSRFADPSVNVSNIFPQLGTCRCVYLPAEWFHLEGKPLQ